MNLEILILHFENKNYFDVSLKQFAFEILQLLGHFISWKRDYLLLCLAMRSSVKTRHEMTFCFKLKRLFALCSPLLSSSIRLLFFFLFVFPCFLSPCDEEQRTMLASPFEFGVGCVFLVFPLFFWVFLTCFGLRSLFFSSPRFCSFLLSFFVSVFLFSAVRGLFFLFVSWVHPCSKSLSISLCLTLPVSARSFFFFCSMWICALKTKAKLGVCWLFLWFFFPCFCFVCFSLSNQPPFFQCSSVFIEPGGLVTSDMLRVDHN